MAFTRQQSKEKAKPTFIKSEYVASEADSTVAHWGPEASQAPKRKNRRTEPFTQGGVDWQNLPDGPLLRIFELLFADLEAKAAMHNAAATCTQWRGAFYEVTLGDTAASRPERPPLVQDNNVKKEAPANTATTCAAVCEPSKSETNGFEACSNRRQVAASRGAATAAAAGGTERRRLYAGPQLRALAGLGAAVANGAAAAAGSEDDAAAQPLAAVAPQQRLRRQRTPAADGDEPADMSPAQQQLPVSGKPLEQDGVHAPAAARRRLGTATAPPRGARRRTASLTPSEQPVPPAAGAVPLAPTAEPHTSPTAAAGRGGRRTAGGKRPAALQQLQEDEVMQPVAARHGRGRQRHVAAAAGVSEGADALTDEVVQPTTAQGGDVATAAGRRRRQRASARASAAAAAAAAAGAPLPQVVSETAAEEGDEMAVEQQQQQPAATTNPRMRRHSQHHVQQQQQQQVQGGDEPQQRPADSTEAMAQGEAVAQGAERPNRGQDRQNSGSNRPAGDSWFGGLFHIPSWFRRGGNS